MARRSSYTYRRIASTMEAPRPVETPDTDASTVYAQRWRKQDGSAVRSFSVLALDEQMAEEMGMLRLAEHYNQNPMAWKLELNRADGHVGAQVIAVLCAETPDETKLREDAFCDRLKGVGA